MTKVMQSDTPWHQKRWVKWARDSIVVLAIFAAINAWQTRNMLATDGSVYIQDATMVGLDGDVHQLFTPINQDKPTLVYFFAPWCNVCEMSIGNLNGLDTGKINVVRIALDYSSTESVADFVDRTRSEGPILLGSNEIKRTFQVPGYPSFYLLDENQMVVGKSMGYSPEWGLKLKNFVVNRI